MLVEKEDHWGGYYWYLIDVYWLGSNYLNYLNALFNF